jgi:hypothetical protein
MEREVLRQDPLKQELQKKQPSSFRVSFAVALLGVLMTEEAEPNPV